MAYGISRLKFVRIERIGSLKKSPVFVDKKEWVPVGERLQNPPVRPIFVNSSMIEFEIPEVNREAGERSLNLEVFRYVIGPGIIE